MGRRRVRPQCVRPLCHRGIEGAADLKAEGGDGDGRITAGELAAFVQQKVERWARHTKGVLQKPVLIDNDKIADRMELVVADENYVPPVPRKYAEPADLLAAAWKEYFELEKMSPHPAVYAPHLWRQYQDTLLRYEALLRADDALSAERLTTPLQTLKGQIARARESLRLRCVDRVPGDAGPSRRRTDQNGG